MRSLTKSNQGAGRNRLGALFGPAQSRGEGRLGHIYSARYLPGKVDSDCNCPQGPVTHGSARKPNNYHPRHRSKMLWSDDEGEALVEHNKTPRMPDRHWRSS